MKAISIISILFFAIVLVRGQESSKVLYLGGKAHLGTGKMIENSAIVVENGKFQLVANALVIKIDSTAYDSIIYLKGQHVYPGFIAPNSTLGLTEIDAVRATRDFMEVGNFKPHVRSIIAYNTDSDIVPTVRSNGILLAQITPRGGRVTGTSSIATLENGNWEDVVYKENDGVHINWPKMYKSSRWSRSNGIQLDATYSKKVEELKLFMLQAKAYAELKSPDETDLRFESMKGVFDGSKKLFIQSDYIKEILEIIALKKELKLESVVLVGGYDAWMAAELLKENNIPVMIKRVHSLPERPQDDVDLPYRLPKLLQDAGVLFCMENSGDMEAMGTRNLPFYAGTAVAYGLNYEQAVASITLNTAKILGIDHKTGSLEKGKDANFIISKGDALDMRTNHITQAFVKGVSIDLNNRQSDLYIQYKNKYKLD